MKTSSNREQQLFLVTGGAILFLILAVVVFNMISAPSPVPEEITQPISKVHTAEPQIPEAGKEGSDPWRINVGPGSVLPVQQNPDNTVYLAPKEIQPPPAAAAGSKITEDPLGKSRQLLNPAAAPNPGQNEATKPSPNPSATAQNKTNAGNPGAAPPPEAAAHPGNAVQPARPAVEKPSNKQPPVKTAKVPEKTVVHPEPTTKVPEKPVIHPEQTVKVTEKAVIRPEPPRATQTAKAPPTSRPDYSEAIAQVIARQYSAAETAPSGKPAPAAKQPTPTKSAAVASAGSSYQIQLGSFATTDRAQALADRINAVPFQGRRIPVNLSSVTLNGKTVVRVRAGPFVNRNNAEAALQAISQRAGVPGSIVAQD
ncbi:MAG TPA: hypothetical protein HPQ00_13795 [Magnetococcales bacterium]|nr:hypothetical protein [Magnetococcales bacterium]